MKTLTIYCLIYYLMAVFALAACFYLCFLYRRIAIRHIIMDINRRLRENSRLDCILALFTAIPLRKLWEESFEFDNYIKALITDADSLNKCLFDINAVVANEKKREIVLELITESMDRAFSTEDFAKIYADCIMKNVAQKMAGLDDNIFVDEKRFIGLIITKKHITRDIDQRKESFKARVLRLLDNFIIDATNQNERILMRIEMERFKNSPLPTPGEDELMAQEPSN